MHNKLHLKPIQTIQNIQIENNSELNVPLIPNISNISNISNIPNIPIIPSHSAAHSAAKFIKARESGNILIREHSTILDKKGINQNSHPTMISIQVHSIQFDSSSVSSSVTMSSHLPSLSSLNIEPVSMASVDSPPKISSSAAPLTNSRVNGLNASKPVSLGSAIKPSRVSLSHRNSKHIISAVPYANQVDFQLSFHSLLFDVCKINVLKQQLFTWSKIGQAIIKLSDLPYLEGFQTLTFPLVRPTEKDVTIGSITLHCYFTYDSLENSLDYSLHDTLKDLDIPYTASPTSFLPNPTPPPSTSSTEDSISDLYRNFSDVTASLARKSTTSSTRSSSSTLSYYKRSSKEGMETLTHLFTALASTGWKMNKVDFVRAMAVMQSFYHAYPIPKTNEIIKDVNQLRIAAYFLNFTHPSYGALALNYFGYGRLTDVLKLNQDYKAALAHLQIEKEHMLLWQYESHGMFSQKPCFYVAYDVHTRAIILCIRGTFGVADAITDLNGEYTPFLGGTAHGGSVQAALWIRDNYLTQIIKWIREYNCGSLHLLGHSLGGAIATLLLMLVRDEVVAEFGDEFVCSGYGFATPPCVSHDLVAEWERHVWTYVNEYDPVPKTSYGALMDLKELLGHAALMAKSPGTREAKFASLRKLQMELRRGNKHPRLLVPGQVFLMYQKDGFVVERSRAEHLDSFDVRADMLV